MASRRPDTWRRWLSVTVVAVGGLVCLGYAALLTADGRVEDVAAWPTAPGVVLEISSHPFAVPNSPTPGSVRRLWVRYTYTVAGAVYQSSRFTPAGEVMNAGAADAAQRRYRPGAACEVRYDPTDPERAFLEAGAEPGEAGRVAVAGLAAAGLLLLALAGLGVWTRHSAGGTD